MTEKGTNLAKRPGTFAKGNPGGGRKPTLAKLGIPESVLNCKEKSYINCLQQAANYTERRCRELSDIYGYLSSGASAQVANSALALAASRYLLEKFAEQPTKIGNDGEPEVYTRLLDLALQMAALGVKCEKASIDVMEKELQARQRQEQAIKGEEEPPWKRTALAPAKP